jgi:pilus assembly protein CpaF
MLQAMNTGVEGSMTTIHANSPRDAFSRLQSMMLMADIEMPARVLVQQMSNAIKLVLQLARLQDGTRKVLTVAEVVGVEDDRVKTKDIFIFERTGVTDQGKVQGRFKWTGYKPKVLDRFRMMGVTVPDSIWDEVVSVNL